MEITPNMEDRGKAVVADEDMVEPKCREEMDIDNLLKALNDLAKGQKEMLEEIKMQNRERTTPRGFLFGETFGASQQLDHPSPAAQRPLASGPA